LDIERLVAMANDIAAFFDAEPDKAVAAEGVRFHLSRFWEARMRRAIIAHLEAGGAGLSPTARSAISLLVPPPAPAGEPRP
jgi:formate dehydrogenase subunit delta